MQKSPLLLVLSIAACTGGPGSTYQEEPSEIAEAIANELNSEATISPTSVNLGYRIHSIPNAVPLGEVNLESCQVVESLLVSACEVINGFAPDLWCNGQTTYFMAHSTPRCAARIQLWSYNEEGGGMPDIYAFDLSGAPTTDPPDDCGNGVIDENESCDDGNHEAWDGCDPTCQVEDFQGCEAVIEEYYKTAEVAIVDQNLWDGPRSQIMVNNSVVPLREVDSASCNAALATGADVCNELASTMPFVAWCQPTGALRSETDGDACDVRFEVTFQTLEPASGVFTTAFTGILGFTIK
jgi:cysteine-rich repeat protein